MTLNAALEIVRSLPANEQREVAETILDELDPDGGETESISEVERAFIEARLARYRASPQATTPFEEVIAELEAKYEQ